MSPLDVGIDPSHRKAEKNKASRAQIRVRFFKIYIFLVLRPKVILVV